MYRVPTPPVSLPVLFSVPRFSFPVPGPFCQILSTHFRCIADDHDGGLCFECVVVVVDVDVVVVVVSVVAVAFAVAGSGGGAGGVGAVRGGNFKK